MYHGQNCNKNSHLTFSSISRHWRVTEIETQLFKIYEVSEHLFEIFSVHLPFKWKGQFFFPLSYGLISCHKVMTVFFNWYVWIWSYLRNYLGLPPWPTSKGPCLRDGREPGSSCVELLAQPCDRAVESAWCFVTTCPRWRSLRLNCSPLTFCSCSAGDRRAELNCFPHFQNI